MSPAETAAHPSTDHIRCSNCGIWYQTAKDWLAHRQACLHRVAYCPPITGGTRNHDND